MNTIDFLITSVTTETGVFCICYSNEPDYLILMMYTHVFNVTTVLFSTKNKSRKKNTSVQVLSGKRDVCRILSV